MTFAASTAPLLDVRNLRVCLASDRGPVFAVDDVSFTLNRGKTLGLVGESGCGKSVLCRALMKILPRSAIVQEDACILFNGRNLSRLSEKEMKRIRGREIAMVFQDPMSSLNPVMKVGEQIIESLTHHQGMKRKPALERAIELLEITGIPMPEQRVNQYPHQLSGGIRQRVAIAIALSCKPKLLIADEPTTALDVTVQADILDLLCRLQTKQNMTMILVTHDLDVAADSAHEIAVMYAGKIVEKAPASKLFSHMRMPYTRALMDSIPHLDDPPHTRLKTIGGQPPDIIDPPPGCRFAPRCPTAKALCFEKEPPITVEEGDHLFACWFPLGATS